MTASRPRQSEGRWLVFGGVYHRLPPDKTDVMICGVRIAPEYRFVERVSRRARVCLECQRGSSMAVPGKASRRKKKRAKLVSRRDTDAYLKWEHERRQKAQSAHRADRDTWEGDNSVPTVSGGLPG